MDIFKHPDFRVQSATIVHLILRLEWPFKATVVVTYNLWKEGDGDQKSEMVMRDCLDVFGEMHNPLWKNDFDLVFRAIFDDLG